MYARPTLIPEHKSTCCSTVRTRRSIYVKSKFLEATGTQKSIHLTLITTRGLSQNAHSDIFQNVVGADSLFAE